jgi:hypothetical protein
MRPSAVIRVLCICVIALAVPALLTSAVFAADLLVDSSSTATSVIVNGVFPAYDNIIFKNQVKRWTDPYSPQKGLWFQNGITTQLYANIRNYDEVETNNHSPVIGVSGPNTQVVYHGYFTADTYQTFPYLDLINGGKFTIAADATIDLVQDAGTSVPAAYWTRQLWLRSDGTGTLEVQEGFQADRTNNGTQTIGFGSVQVSNATFVTNHTRNIPLGYKPYGGTHVGPNGHVSFVNVAGGTWRVQTNDQSSVSAFWAYVNCSIDTRTSLTHTGSTIPYDDMTMYNAFQTMNDNITVYKKGPATLNINGEQAYAPGAIMDIQEGTVNYNSDPMNGGGFYDYGGGNHAAHQNLTPIVRNSATANFNASLNRIKTVTVYDSGTARVASGKTLNLLSAATLNGGTLTGGGTVSGGVTNTAGNVNPGDISAKGTLAITGAYSQGASGKFTAEISSAGCDALSVSGAATLAGTIDSSLLGGFTPTAETSYDVLTAGSISGTFSNAGVNIAGGYLKANYTATKVSLLALRQGDSNGDKTVDVVDLGLLATSYGAASGATWQMGDYNHDGAVDVIDLGLLATNYGTTYGAAGDVVPEPTTLCLLMVSAFLSRRKR